MAGDVRVVESKNVNSWLSIISKVAAMLIGDRLGSRGCPSGNGLRTMAGLLASEFYATTVIWLPGMARSVPMHDNDAMDSLDEKKLGSTARKKSATIKPSKDYPTGRFPMPDKSHARAALRSA